MVSAKSDSSRKNDYRSPMAGGSSSRPAMTLAHLSDPHISCIQDITVRHLLGKRLFGYLRWKLHRGAKHADSVLLALQADLSETGPDHIAVTGDLTHLSLPAEFQETKQWLQSLGSPSQVTVIPGNHDQYVDMAWRKTLACWTDYMVSDSLRNSNGTADNPAHIFPSLRIRGCIALIGICTARPSAPHLATGSIGARQLQKLEDVLTQTARQKYFRVILIHHSPAPGMDSWRKRLTDAADLQSLLARCGAELILHGHSHRTHQSYLKAPNGSIPVMGAPSISALDRRPEHRARYCLYHISPGDRDWKVSLEARIYSPEQNRFVTELTRQLCGSPS
jgi:3',5'-cyclic AMP phosphodiesterase CpdA